MNIHMFSDVPGLFFCTSTCQFKIESRFTRNCDDLDATVILKYIKMRFRNRGVFESNFMQPINDMIQLHQISTTVYDESVSCKDELDKFELVVQFFDCTYDQTTPFSYTEAFELTNPEFQSIVFGQIRVPQMIKALGHSRIASAGKPVRHKQFDINGDFTGYKEYDVIFETHRVNATQLGLRDDIYAIRCWCTTTNNEHWLWIEDKYKTEPLEAIASTFRVHENLIPFIKELKRQGDILLVELTGDIEPLGNMVPLSSEQYFSLLTAQS
jgi:hypothetical protein